MRVSLLAAILLPAHLVHYFFEVFELDVFELRVSRVMLHCGREVFVYFFEAGVEVPMYLPALSLLLKLKLF